MALFERSNHALLTNGPGVTGEQTPDIAITTHGSDFYFAICACMGAATIAFIGLAMTKPKHDRTFHYLTATITMVATIAYFSMGSNLGWASIFVQYLRPNMAEVAGVDREVFYARYIDWFVTTPLLLLDLLLTAAMPWPSIFMVIAADIVMIVTGLIGALTASSYKWGYFTFGCAALFYIIWELAWTARKHAYALGSDVGRAFMICGSLTTVLWILYPIAWGVCEGGNLISPDSEAVFYGILDLFAKPVFGALLIWGHRNIDPARIGLHIRDIADEKHLHNGHGHHTDTGNGVTEPARV